MMELGYSYSSDNISHKCCNVCAVRCKCGDEHCGSTSFVTIRDESTQSATVLAESSVVRSVSANEKAQLRLQDTFASVLQRIAIARLI